mmetsp:Transcript_25493/g.19249  ORF Transcript_25493/g.19249 Transcript_25493/m.19249 type:complete len:123 (+) Transcript_25493:340-708(+)
MSLQTVQIEIVLFFGKGQLPIELEKEALLLKIDFSQRYTSHVGDKIISVEDVIEELGSHKDCRENQPVHGQTVDDNRISLEGSCIAKALDEGKYNYSLLVTQPRIDRDVNVVLMNADAGLDT